MGHFPLFSSVFSLFAALKFSSLTNFPPFFAFDFEFNSVEYNNKYKIWKQEETSKRKIEYPLKISEQIFPTRSLQ